MQREVFSHYNHGRIVLFSRLRVYSVTSTKAHLPHLLVPPCFYVPASPSALPAADIEDSLYLSGSSFDDSTHGTLHSAGTCSAGRGR